MMSDNDLKKLPENQTLGQILKQVGDKHESACIKTLQAGLSKSQLEELSQRTAIALN